MNKIKKKINIMLLIFVVLMLISNRVYATDSNITITKQTDKVIEGTIETIVDEYDGFEYENAVSTSQNIDPNKFYYNQLKSNISRNVYNELKKDTTGVGITNLSLTNQTYSIDVNRFLNDKSYRSSTVINQIEAYVFDAIIAFCNDNPSIYWYYTPKVSEIYSINKEKKQITYKSIKLTSIIEERNDYKRFNQKLKEVANSINGTSTYEIVKKCHDYICDTVVYTKKEGTCIDQTAYDALINQQGVCDAEARLFQLLCNLKGVKSIKVSGSARKY